MTIELEGHLTMLTRTRDGKSSVYLHSNGNTYELAFASPGIRGKSMAPLLARCGPGREVCVRGDFESDTGVLKLHVRGMHRIHSEKNAE